MADRPADPRGAHSAEGADSANRAFLDTTAYGAGPDDSVTDVTEGAAVTHHVASVGAQSIAYTATAGHLVAVDGASSKPAAKIFYVAFTKDGAAAETRPVTFFYNGGPGSSAVFLLLGSFAPRRIHTSLPGFTPPPPYRMEDNPDSLIDRSDLVFVNPPGTGYSSAVAPFRNRDFWGVDQDARIIKQFIKRYLTANGRWNSPKFLFGESYGTARTCVLAWLLHKDGIDLNGLTLQSSVLDYPANFSNAVGLMPTFAADAWYHGRTGVTPPPPDLPAFMDTVTAFSSGSYATALAAYPNQDSATVQTLSQYLGIPPNVLVAWQLSVEASDRLGHSLFLVTLLQDKGLALGAYDGRVTGVDTGIAAIVSPDGGMNDPTMAAVGGVYTAMWNDYLNRELLFVSTSNFVDLNDQAFQFWDFSHTDPAGVVQKPDAQGNPTLYTAGDLAAAMAANPYLLVLSANGYFDSVTPFWQTRLSLDAMPLADAAARANLTFRCYPSGHMVYLDGGSRTALKGDLATLYDHATRTLVARLARMSLAARTNRTPIHPYFKLSRPGTSIRPSAVGAAPWEVADLCAAYAWPQALAGGGVIGIVELGGGWLPSDVDAYFGTRGLPKPAIVDVGVGGANRPTPGGDPSANPDGEVALDIQVAAAAYSVATGRPASIRIYWADAGDWSSMATAVSAAAADGCDVCSISWGTDEANWLAAGQTAGEDFAGRLDAAIRAAAASGMTVFAASGDNDSSDGGPTPANVDLPSSSPFAIGCGGTSKPRGGGEETVWNNNPGDPKGAGTGGGFSTIFKPMPPWQAGAPHGPGRMIPDVAASADPNFGYAIVVHGRSLAFGGTSAVAPLYAGLFAAFGRKLSRAQPERLITPHLYRNQTSFTDIVSGDNGFYRARIGPDPCTGLGAPIGRKIAALFGAQPATATAAEGAPGAAEEPTAAQGRGRVARHRSRPG